VSWRWDAACAGHPNPDLWFPYDSDSFPAAREALTVCCACPVRTACRAEAFAHPETSSHGVWGGLIEAQRRRTRLAAGTPAYPYRSAGGPKAAAQ
jgi:WhiB family redox-sensing transcriptional regulator